MRSQALLLSWNPAATFAVLTLLVALAGRGYTTELDMALSDPARVVEAYLRATYARDFVRAYELISSADKKVRDVNRYVQQRGAFSGFILEAAKKLSAAVEIEPRELKGAADRIQLRVRYRVPDTEKIAPILLNWNPFELNSLGAPDRERLLATLTKKRHDRTLDMIEGEESFELVKERNEWKIYLNWAAGVKVPLQLDTSRAEDLHVELSKQQVILQPGDIFEIRLKIRNKTTRPITTRIGHLVESRDNADYLDFVQCGFLLPVTIPAEKEQEYSGTYMLRGSLPEGVRQLKLTYDFRILK